jgi:nephrocystin-3
MIMNNVKNREVRVFISSTFQGMNNDRKTLVDHVFPEIRRRCSERGIGFTEVDLRWGITEEDVKSGSIVDICFKQIDNCQPFFIGLLGEYYGSPLEVLEGQIDTACSDYPWIKSGYLDNSITELEILYSIFNVGQNHSDDQHRAIVENALFYFRDPNSADTVPETDPEKRTKQANLKQRLRDYHCQIEPYNQAEDLKNLVIEPLWEKITQKFPHSLTEQQKINFEHDAFANSRQRVYIKRQTDFDRLSQHAQSDDAPLIIYGESGSGKTALLANWAEEYQQKHSDELVIWHFCGNSADSTNPIELLRRIMLNLKTHFNMEEELPTTPEAIKEQFGQWLANATKPVTLIIDGFNQLQETEITRGWWHYIPAKTRLFVSTISADDLPTSWQRWELDLLTEKSARQALITEYLQQYGKRLADKPMEYLLAHPQTANPLYLQVILEELRVFGEFDKLEQHLKGYLKTKTIPALYEKVLARLEADYQPEGFEHLVADSLSLLWAARQGLNESELLKILDIPQAVWSPLYLALQNALVSRGGLLSFFHDYLKQAVENRYLSSREDQQQWHLRLANYFDELELDSRIANELPWQLQQAGEKERLRNCISDILMFLQLDRDNRAYDLWGYWLELEPDKTMVKAYDDSLAKYEKTEQPEEKDLAYVLNNLGFFFDKAGYFDAAIPLFCRACEIYKDILGPEDRYTINSQINLFSLYIIQGDDDRVEQLYQVLDKKVFDKEDLYTASYLNNLGVLHYNKIEYELAEQCYKRALKILEKVLGPEHPDTVMCRNNLAVLIKKAKGDYDRAELLHQEVLATREKVLESEHPDIAQSMNNLAALLDAKGEYDRAEPCYQRALEITKKVLGVEHNDTILYRKNLESCRAKMNKK